MNFFRIMLLCLLLVSADGMAENSFDILEYRVDGNANLLSTLQVEEAVYPHLGVKKTINDVEGARNDLEKAYHDAGYLTVLVDIPEQTVNSGIVHLRVVEGKVGKVRVTGSRYYSMNRILARVP
ncbi:MAG TPA: POTRA domain-containing protein, partial [Burkholderiales bacterium]|nr:POTRA domain-containing protein [Burkholderiales bacterium]